MWVKLLMILAGVVPKISGQSCHLDQPHLAVSTTNGVVVGHLASNVSCVAEYLGIPYAQPPIGQLRFAPPQKLVANATYLADDFGYDCPQTPLKPVNYPDETPQGQRILSYFLPAGGTAQSEDCLTLNIWAKPSENSKSANKPVLVFFYGGRFANGNTNSPFYTGKYFADAQDLVIVTVNYRLNVFGFPGAPGETQNLGLRDQRAAVEWVRDNIQSFGGDASKITISGQSAGGVGVDYWAYAYPSDPIIHGLIAHSGNVYSFPGNTIATQEQNWETVVTAVGCANLSTSVATMSCVRNANWTDIETAAAAIKPGTSNTVLRGIPPFWPMVDGEIVFHDYRSLTTQGLFAHLPALYGNNNDEDGYYRVTAFGNGVVATDDQAKSFVLDSFTCPISYQADARTIAGMPSWVYRYMADWDNTRLFPTSGAYHGVDLHMTFGASLDVSGLPTTADQRELMRLMQKAWFAFCDDPQSGLINMMEWPKFDHDAKTLIILGQNNTPTSRLVSPSDFDASCSGRVLSALWPGANSTAAGAG